MTGSATPQGVSCRNGYGSKIAIGVSNRELGSETYTYDNLQRLTLATRTGASAMMYRYHVLGNFTSKGDYSTDVAGAYT